MLSARRPRRVVRGQGRSLAIFPRIHSLLYSSCLCVATARAVPNGGASGRSLQPAGKGRKSPLCPQRVPPSGLTAKAYHASRAVVPPQQCSHRPSSCTIQPACVCCHSIRWGTTLRAHEDEDRGGVEVEHQPNYSERPRTRSREQVKTGPCKCENRTRDDTEHLRDLLRRV